MRACSSFVGRATVSVSEKVVANAARKTKTGGEQIHLRGRTRKGRGSRAGGKRFSFWNVQHQPSRSLAIPITLSLPRHEATVFMDKTISTSVRPTFGIADCSVLLQRVGCRQESIIFYACLHYFDHTCEENGPKPTTAGVQSGDVPPSSLLIVSIKHAPDRRTLVRVKHACVGRLIIRRIESS